jgi:hypothetical protein
VLSVVAPADNVVEDKAPPTVVAPSVVAPADNVVEDKAPPTVVAPSVVAPADNVLAVVAPSVVAPADNVLAVVAPADNVLSVVAPADNVPLVATLPEPDVTVNPPSVRLPLSVVAPAANVPVVATLPETDATENAPSVILPVTPRLLFMAVAPVSVVAPETLKVSLNIFTPVAVPLFVALSTVTGTSVNVPTAKVAEVSASVRVEELLPPVSVVLVVPTVKPSL